jgi:putative heme-binding domain-containing protein
MAAIADIADPRAAGVYVDILSGKNAPLRERALRSLGQVADESLAPLERQVNRMTPEALAAIQGVYTNHKRAKSGPLFAKRPQPINIGEYARFAQEHRGDARRGRALFADPKGLACAKCHANAQVQATVTGTSSAGTSPAGPDLTTVGKQFPRAAIIESVLYPSKAIREGYQQFNVSLDDGTVLSGLIQGETETALVLVDRDAKRHEISKDQIVERKPSNASMMPENVHVGLSLDEFADLIAFLESCREPPK